nr:chaplin [Catenulispora acidiphila]
MLCANEGGPSYSSANAVATSSPGLVSGNVVQVPVDAPLNVCGITANVVGVFDTAAGTTCVNGGERHGHWEYPGDLQEHHVGAGAKAVTANSSGAVTGNVLQVPIEAPINACGDSVDLVGVFDSALDNRCVNHTAGGAGAEGRAIGNNGLAAGNVAQLPINIPTEICGVVAAFGAYHDTAAGNSCVNTGAPTTFSAGSATGETGIITGNVVQGSVNAPLQLCGTTLGAGLANSGTEDTGCSTGPAMSPIDGPPPPATHSRQHQEHLHRHRRPTHEEMGQLPHTGSDVLDYAGLGAGALVLGAGALIASRRKSSSAN